MWCQKGHKHPKIRVSQLPLSWEHVTVGLCIQGPTVNLGLGLVRLQELQLRRDFHFWNGKDGKKRGWITSRYMQ